MNKQNKISLILGVLVLTVLIVTSSFAYFQITNTGSTETNTTFTGNLEDVESYGTASLSGPNNKLHIKIKASDMAPTKIGTHYYATVNPDLDYELDKQNHLISTASIKNGEGNENVVYECTSDLLIEASGSLVTDNVINAADGNIYFGGKGSTIEPTEISLKDIIDAQSTGGYKKQVKYKITGNGEATLTTDIDIINRNDDQNDIAGKEINLTITNKNLVCTVKGLQEKAYMVQIGYEYYDEYSESGNTYPIFYYGSWFDDNILENVVSASFVDYIPSDLEDSKILEYKDLSNTKMGTEKESIIAWLEETEDHNGEYNLYIGSESKIYVEHLNVFFAQMGKLQNVDFSNLDTSETKSMEGMFDMSGYYGDSPIANLDLSGLDTSQVTDMSYMFREFNANITFPQEFGSSATDMSDMFDRYKGDTLDLSTFDTSKVTDMSDMFSGCSSLTTLDLSTFDTSQVTNMSWMFSYTSFELPFKDLPNFVTKNVENMSGMFAGYEGTTLDLSTFDISQVTDMSYMFRYSNANITFLEGFGSSATDMNNMFANYQGTALDLSSFDTSKVTDMSYMFYDTSVELPFKEWPNFVTTNVEEMHFMFYRYQGTSLDLSTFDTSSVISMAYMFDSASVDLPFKNWPKFVTSNVKDMRSMFSSYEGTTLDLSSFDTSNVTDMYSMFSNTSIELSFKDWSNFDTSQVTDMSYMFRNYKGTELDLSSFDTSSLTNMSSMFADCIYLEYLNLSSFKFDNIRTGYSGTNDTFSDVPSNCVVEIKRSQQATFEDKFPLSSSTYDGNRLFNPTPVD